MNLVVSDLESILHKHHVFMKYSREQLDLLHTTSNSDESQIRYLKHVMQMLNCFLPDSEFCSGIQSNTYIPSGVGKDVMDASVLENLLQKLRNEVVGQHENAVDLTAPMVDGVEERCSLSGVRGIDDDDGDILDSLTAIPVHQVASPQSFSSLVTDSDEALWNADISGTPLSLPDCRDGGFHGYREMFMSINRTNRCETVDDDFQLSPLSGITENSMESHFSSDSCTFLDHHLPEDEDDLPINRQTGGRMGTTSYGSAWITSNFMRNEDCANSTISSLEMNSDSDIIKVSENSCSNSCSPFEGISAASEVLRSVNQVRDQAARVFQVSPFDSSHSKRSAQLTSPVRPLSVGSNASASSMNDANIDGGWLDEEARNAMQEMMRSSFRKVSSCCDPSSSGFNLPSPLSNFKSWNRREHVRKTDTVAHKSGLCVLCPTAGLAGSAKLWKSEDHLEEASFAIKRMISKSQCKEKAITSIHTDASNESEIIVSTTEGTAARGQVSGHSGSDHNKSLACLSELVSRIADGTFLGNSGVVCSDMADGVMDDDEEGFGSHRRVFHHRTHSGLKLQHLASEDRPLSLHISYAAMLNACDESKRLVPGTKQIADRTIDNGISKQECAFEEGCSQGNLVLPNRKLKNTMEFRRNHTLTSESNQSTPFSHSNRRNHTLTSESNQSTPFSHSKRRCHHVYDAGMCSESSLAVDAIIHERRAADGRSHSNQVRHSVQRATAQLRPPTAILPPCRTKFFGNSSHGVTREMDASKYSGGSKANATVMQCESSDDRQRRRKWAGRWLNKLCGNENSVSVNSSDNNRSSGKTPPAKSKSHPRKHSHTVTTAMEPDVSSDIARVSRGRHAREMDTLDITDAIADSGVAALFSRQQRKRKDPH